MAKKIYRTMQGKQIDIEKFISANEMTQAVGNMKVNARGDVLGPGGKIVKTREEVMSEYYRDNPTAVKHDTLSAGTGLAPDAAEPVTSTTSASVIEEMPREAENFSLEDQEVFNIKKSYGKSNKG